MASHSVLVDQWFETGRHLGGNYPFYKSSLSSSSVTDIAQLVSNTTVQVKIDPVGLIEVIGRGYPLGDRTLISGIERAPWFGIPDGSDGWNRLIPPTHGKTIKSFGEAAKQFKELLCDEVATYCEHKSTIGLLISGGMDSRITAGIVRELQQRARIDCDVVCITWGVSNSRDVLYSARIARTFGWHWQQIELDSDVLRRNILAAGEMGAEFSPIHLHGMLDARDIGGIDAYLAASFGDMVGRAEFSGRHALKLRPLPLKSSDRFGLIRRTLLQDSLDSMRGDAFGYRNFIRSESPSALREMDYHANYTRRLLCGAMSTVAMRVPLYQIFTHPDSFGFMWNLDYSIRTNDIYAELLKLLPGRLGEIPWARTGTSYGSRGQPSDDYGTEHHRYGEWMRNDLRKEMARMVQSEEIYGLNLFNEFALDQLMSIWPKSNTITTNAVDELVSWIASLSAFIRKYSVAGLDKYERTPCQSLAERSRSVIGAQKARAYIRLRDRFRQ